MKRHPLTAAYFQEQKVRPKIIRTLSPDIVAWTRDLHYGSQYLMRPQTYQTRGLYLEALAEALLYADFVFAHGDAEAKAYAVDFLVQVQDCLIFAKDDPILAQTVAREFLWPTLDAIPSSFRGNNTFRYWAWMTVYRTVGKIPKDRIRLEKWMVNHGNMEPLQTGARLGLRANNYLDSKDLVGALMCHLAAAEPDQLYLDKLELLRNLWTRQYGQEKGMAYYKRMLECLAPLCKTSKILQEELTKLQKTRAVSGKK